MKEKVAVIYLSWLPYGVNLFKRFLDTYTTQNTSIPHDVVFVFNGLQFVPENSIDEFKSVLEHHQHLSFSCFYYQQGQDIEIYREVSRGLNNQRILFLNSYSQLQQANWLDIFLNHFSPQVGLISASASYQSYYSSVFQKHSFKWEPEKGAAYNFRKYKLFVKALFYWRWLFHPFPNPHARTNAFMVRREEFLQMKVKAIDTKFKAYLFENGRRSLTNYYLRKGLKVLVIGKNGKTYEPSEWKSSNTFWIGNQENLLVSDNQTELYQQGTESERRSMTKLAWGI